MVQHKRVKKEGRACGNGKNARRFLVYDGSANCKTKFRCYVLEYIIIIKKIIIIITIKL